MSCAVEYSVDNLGIRLRRLREAKGLTQMELDAASNVRQTTISAIEGGKRAPRKSTIQLLANGLGLGFEEVYAYLNGRGKINLRQSLGVRDDEAVAWSDRNPALLGRAVAVLMGLDEDEVQAFVDGAAGVAAPSRSGGTGAASPPSGDRKRSGPRTAG